MIFQINDMPVTRQLAHAAAATAITALMLVGVGLGFAAPTHARATHEGIHEALRTPAGVSLVARFE